MKKLAFLFCACIILFGCTRTPKVDTTAEANAIRDLENQWIAANKSKDFDKVLTFFSNEAILIEPNTPICEGLQSIKEILGSMATDTTFLWETYSATIDKIEVAASGDLAYVRGITRMNIKTPDGLTEYTARWVEIWKKIDGQWKNVLAIANS
jgi:ketosteroid isomerase-like protein